MKQEKNKKQTVLICVCGSIAAYKSLFLIRLLKESGYELKVAATSSALKFIGEISFKTLSKNSIYKDQFELGPKGEMLHIEWTKNADLICVIPATANSIAKFACGLCDDPVSQVVLSSSCPVLIAPAMEPDMYQNSITQRNIKELKNHNRFQFIGPEKGELASGKIGLGRLTEPQEIFEKIEEILSKKDFSGKKVLITAGPTREFLDPVRFISNASSGKTGFALAKELSKRGALVHLVAGPTNREIPPGVEFTGVNSADEMLKACEEVWDKCHVGIFSAAVADYTFEKTSPDKLKKEHFLGNLQLSKTPDVIKNLSKKKGSQLVVGFALESEKLLVNAQKKLKEKGCDLLIANQITKDNPALGADSNQISIFKKGQEKGQNLGKHSKNYLATLIADELLKLF